MFHDTTLSLMSFDNHAVLQETESKILITNQKETEAYITVKDREKMFSPQIIILFNQPI